MRRIFFWIGFLLLILFYLPATQSCNIINPHENVPTYIHVDSFHFAHNPKVTDRPVTHSITQVWVYYNGNNIGIFDLPCTFPVNMSGDTAGRIELYPGVLMDGLNNFTETYPFYQPDTNLLLKSQPGKIVTYEPTTSFYSDLSFTTLSYFLGNTGFTAIDGTMPLEFADDSTDGFYEGVINLSSPSADSSIDSCNTTFSVPLNEAAYVEFDYRCNIPFYVGLQANLSNLISSAPYYLSGMYPTTKWQKFYLNVADFNAQYKGTSYTLFFKASLPDGSTSGKVEIANVQFVTF
jgi:hypothetical protein